MFSPTSSSFYGSGRGNQFDSIRIGLASPEKIRTWSYGEVTKAETINYRTLKPERDGLFCARIFGPVRDYECLCGKYRYIRYRGITCEKCGVEVTVSRVRRERMGHIELAAPVAHVWFFKSLPSRIGMLLNLTQKSLEKIIYFERYVVIEPGITKLKRCQVLTEEEMQKACIEYGHDAFSASMGAEAIKSLLETMDVCAERDVLAEEIKEIEKKEEVPSKMIKRFRLLDSFVKNEKKIKPEWTTVTVLPVLPPALRPLVPMDGGRFAASDSNELYRRVLNRNSRLKRLIEINAPDIIVRNEKRMLQEAVDALFDNGRSGRVLTGSNKQPLKSLSSMIKGKQGRFRHHLLGKRVDYSGRSVIVAAPYLALDECALPKEMALEIFKPFIYSELLRMGISTVRQAKKIVERANQEAWDALDKVVRGMVILLNRAPTLHRLSLQAFRIVLTPHRAIGTPLMLNTPYNSDNDGDTMTGHAPLSPYPLMEGFVLLMSTNNILGLANGKPIIIPTQDIVLGLHYLTLENYVKSKQEDNKLKCFDDVNDVRAALEGGYVDVHDPLFYSCNFVEKGGKVSKKRYRTTAGRVILHELFPRHEMLNFDLINKAMRQRDMVHVVDLCYRHCGQRHTVHLLESMQSLGLEWAFKSGISFGKDDMLIPKVKGELISEAKSKVSQYEKQWMEGLITEGEKYNKVIDLWSRCSDDIADVMMNEISKPGQDGEYNSIYTMLNSEARGSRSQVRQLLGMRGLMTTPSGEIIEVPIISNFREGLNVMEYFNSTHGARKGLADTALKTASSGYLTRRLVDVAQDCSIIEHDCKTDKGLNVSTIWSESGVVEISLEERILGRVLLKDVTTADKKVIVAANTFIGDEHLELISKHGITSVTIRSVMMCKSINGVCVLCYGRDMAGHDLVCIGEPVGIIAAQSIGEPGTQLTMRTFHAGGAAQFHQQSSFQSPCDGVVKFENGEFVQDSVGHYVVTGRSCEIVCEDKDGNVQLRQRLEYGSRCFKKNDEKVAIGERIVEWDPFTTPIIADVSGKIKINEGTSGGDYNAPSEDSKADEGNLSAIWPSIDILDSKGNSVVLPNGRNAIYLLPAGAILSVQDNQEVSAGEILARIPRGASKTGDITGGMPRVADLFEARQPKDAAIMAHADGTVSLKMAKNRLKVILETSDGREIDYPLSRDRQILVQDGDKVRKGDYIADGNPSPYDVLNILGLEAFAAFLVKEIQAVYRLQGVVIDDKHIEVIGRYMTRQCEIVDSGDSEFFKGEKVQRIFVDEANIKLESESKRSALYNVVLLGITRASLQTPSFISAASFQETTKVLTDAAVMYKEDDLRGLKENMIAARLIPIGTGSQSYKYQELAAQRDKEVLALREKKCEEDMIGES